MINTPKNNPILEAGNLYIEYPINGAGGLRKRTKQAVKNISFKIFPGECLAIVGESGCGKSSIIEAILGFVHPASGIILFNDQNLLKLSSKSFRKLRPQIQPVFQDFNQALNPRMRIRSILKEALHKRYRDSHTDQLLNSVGLDRKILSCFPHQLSGGQKQRVVLARALSVKPTLLLLDEPVTSQDLSVAVQIIKLLINLRKTSNLTFLLVSHNFSIIQLLADRVAVMKNGQFLEQQPLVHLLKNPKHEYTRNIISQTVTL